MRRMTLTAAWLALAAGAAWGQMPTAALAAGNAALQAGEADRALGILTALPTQGPGAAEAQNLICRVRYTLEQWDAAARACEQAVRLDPNSSIDHMWQEIQVAEKARELYIQAQNSLA